MLKLFLWSRASKSRVQKEKMKRPKTIPAIAEEYFCLFIELYEVCVTLDTSTKN